MYGASITPPKSRFKSKTHRFNALMTILFALESNLSLLQPLLPVDSFQILSFILITGNFVLRELTTTGIKK